jgi:pimeloyl-ACP methyl ester carboxylesterase
LKNFKKPLLLLFGDHDWMYYSTAPQSIENWKISGVDAELKIIEKSGHNIHIDNPIKMCQVFHDWVVAKEKKN